MLNVPENTGASDFSGKCLAYFMRRNKSLGIHLPHGRVGDLAYKYAKDVQREHDEKGFVARWSVVAASLHAVIKMKVDRIEEITDTLKNERFDSLEEAHELLRESVRLNEEIEPLNEKLQEMADYG
jgi:hypothetical protein